MDDISNSMEMYLVNIARLRQGDEPVPLSSLAESLEVTPVSVNEMCRKLQDQGLLIYRPYKGALLTRAGEDLANTVLRRHRLWEVFLVEKLGFDYPAAHQAACDLEHVSPEVVIDRLDQYLDFPRVNPVGDPIPQSDGRIPESVALPLASLCPGKTGVLIGWEVTEAQRGFLLDNGIRTGGMLTVTAAGEDNLMIRGEGQQYLSLSRELAGALQVRLQDDDSGQNIDNQQKNVRKEKGMDSIDKKILKRLLLSDLKTGQRAVIVRLSGDAGAVKRRMMDMGMVPGSEVEVVRVAPFGDPIEFSVKGYSLSLRKSEAENIEVELMD